LGDHCLSFFLWQLYCLLFFNMPLNCLSFFNLRFLITSLVYSNFSFKENYTKTSIKQKIENKTKIGKTCVLQKIEPFLCYTQLLVWWMQINFSGFWKFTPRQIFKSRFSFHHVFFYVCIRKLIGTILTIIMYMKLLRSWGF